MLARLTLPESLPCSAGRSRQIESLRRCHNIRGRPVHHAESASGVGNQTRLASVAHGSVRTVRLAGGMRERSALDSDNSLRSARDRSCRFFCPLLNRELQLGRYHSNNPLLYLFHLGPLGGLLSVKQSKTIASLNCICKSQRGRRWLSCAFGSWRRFDHE
jgi:hypothetical protein